MKWNVPLHGIENKEVKIKHSDITNNKAGNSFNSRDQREMLSDKAMALYEAAAVHCYKTSEPRQCSVCKTPGVTLDDCLTCMASTLSATTTTAPATTTSAASTLTPATTATPCPTSLHEAAPEIHDLFKTVESTAESATVQQEGTY